MNCKKESLEQMARNLCKCSPRTLQDVLLHLDEESKNFLISKMKEIQSSESIKVSKN